MMQFVMVKKKGWIFGFCIVIILFVSVICNVVIVFCFWGDIFIFFCYVVVDSVEFFVIYWFSNVLQIYYVFVFCCVDKDNVLGIMFYYVDFRYLGMYQSIGICDYYDLVVIVYLYCIDNGIVVFGYFDRDNVLCCMRFGWVFVCCGMFFVVVLCYGQNSVFVVWDDQRNYFIVFCQFNIVYIGCGMFYCMDGVFFEMYYFICG